MGKSESDKRVKRKKSERKNYIRHKSQGQRNKVIRNKSRIANVTKCFVPQVDQLHVGALRPVEEWGLRGLRGDHHHINTTYTLSFYSYIISGEKTQ